MKSRDSYFDNIKFLLIVLVVTGHIIEPFIGGQTLKPLYLWIYSFHMPLFVFIAGYFSKNLESSGYQTKIISKLIVPYLIFESMYSIFDYFLFEREKLIFSYMTPYWIMWFFFSLIIWKVVLPYANKIKYALPLSFAIAILAGYADDIGYFASISRTLVFFPFFLLGYYFDKRYIEKLLNGTMRSFAIFVLGILFVVFYYYGTEIKVQWFYGSTSYSSLEHNEWFAGIYRLVIYIVAVISGICILILTPQKRIPVLSQLGQNTLYTYLIHGFIVRSLVASGLYSYFNTAWSKGFQIAGGIIIAMVLSSHTVRYLTNWITEPRLNFMFGSELRSNIARNEKSV